MTTHNIFSGCGTALTTPFKDNGSQVDYEAMGRIVDRQMEAKVNFLVPLGTTAETPCLSDVEKIKILEVTRQHSSCPIVVGGGTNSLQQTINSMKVLEPFGPDAFLIVVPYYNKPTQRGLYEYFKAVAGETDKDIILYNVPGRTGANLEAETTLHLAEIPNIVAVKEASGRYSQISEILRNAPKNFSVLSGNDDETLSLMATGASGVISVASNVDPVRMVRLVNALQADDMSTARQLHYELMPLFRNCFIESNPIPVKAALAIMGLVENSLRLPLVPAGETTMHIMEQTIQSLGLQ